MIITKKALDRRTFLRGAGIALSLPLLDSMIPALARASSPAVKTPIRLGFVYVPNGILQRDWVPDQLGTDFQLKATMKHARALQGQDDRAAEPRSSTTASRWAMAAATTRARGATWLTGVHPKKTEGADIHAGISADQIAAKQLAQYTQFGSLEVGIEENTLAGGCDSGYSCAYTNTISWRGPTTPNPMELSPRALFERLFGDGEITDPAVRHRGA